MKKNLLLFVAILLTVCVQAQKKGQARVDSLLRVLKTSGQDTNRVATLNVLASDLLQQNGADSALAISSSALLLAGKINYTGGEARSLYTLGQVYAAKANTAAALKNYENAAALYEKAGMPEGSSDAYHAMGLLNQRTNYDEAIRLFQKSLGAAQQSGNNNLLGRANSIIATTLLRKGEYNEAARYNQLGIQYYTLSNNERGLANCYVASARINHRRGNLQQSLKDNYAALRLYERTGNKTGMYNVHTGLGLIYEDQKNYAEALNSYLASRKSAEELGDKETIANANNNLGNAYRELGKTAEAQKVFEESLKLAQQVGSKKGIANAKGNLGTIYSLTGRPEEAISSYEQAIKVYEELGAKELVGIGYLEMGQVYINEKKPLETKKWVEKALDIARQVQNKDMISRSYLLLTQADTLTGNYQSAFSNHKSYIAYRDSIANAESAKHLIEEKMQYAFSKKEDSLRLQQALIAEKLEKQTLITKQQQQALELQKASLFLAQREKDVQLLGYLKTKAELQLSKEQQEKQLAIANQERALQQARLEKQTLLAKQKEQALLLKDRELTGQRSQRNFWLGGAIALFVLSLFVYRTYRNQRRANTLLQKQQAKTEQALKELKAAQTLLIQSEKMASLGELTAGIAHEIQNPLNFVNNFSEVNDEMLDEMKSELEAGSVENALLVAEGIRENNLKIHHHGKRADAIVKGMLQHSRAGSRKLEPVDINTLADEYLRLSYHGLRAQHKDFNADFSSHFDEGIEKIAVVPQDIGRVLLNLYNNAFYAVNEKKKQLNGTFRPAVSVTTRRLEDKVEIAVRDNGTGIPKKALDKIYQPFFTTKPTGQGTGLGLSLSYDIITAYGGSLKVDTKEGEFTEFTIQLPTGTPTDAGR